MMTLDLLKSDAAALVAQSPLDEAFLPRARPRLSVLRRGTLAVVDLRGDLDPAEAVVLSQVFDRLADDRSIAALAFFVEDSERSLLSDGVALADRLFALRNRFVTVASLGGSVGGGPLLVALAAEQVFAAPAARLGGLRIWRRRRDRFSAGLDREIRRRIMLYRPGVGAGTVDGLMAFGSVLRAEAAEAYALVDDILEQRWFRKKLIEAAGEIQTHNTGDCNG